MQSGRSILLVEDDQVDVLTVKRVLKDLNLNYPLVNVTNGIEALDYLAEHPGDIPTLVLLDLNMPKMNGQEFLEALSHNTELRKFPIVVLTTSNEEKDIARCFELGAVGYMVKPIDYDHFVDTISRIDKYWSTSLIPE